MGLSSELITQFVKITNDSSDVVEESTSYGTIVEYEGKIHVRLDGSELLTPITTAANVRPGERVTVMIKNHTATVTGNLTSPSVGQNDLDDQIDRIDDFEIVIAQKVDTKDFVAEQARIDTLVADDVRIKETLTAAEADIDILQAGHLTVTERLTAAEADIEELIVGNLDVSVLDAKYAKIEDLEATNADVHNLEATYTNFETTTTNKLSAVDASIATLQTDKLDANTANITYAKITDLDVTNANVSNLEADIADIDTLIFGSATGSTIHASFANAVIAQLGDAQIKSAMIESIAANKITTGDIITNTVRVMSEDGSLIISDETIQISDAVRVRVQIGKDSSNDYSINIWDADGNLMFSEGGITDSAIKESIIRNDMVSDTANIAAHKLDIDSLFEEINGSTKTIKSTQIYVDDQAQTLDVAFKELETEVTDLGSTISSQGTQISVMQGQIESKVWQQDIDTATDDMSTRYSILEQEVDSISTTVASHDSQIANKADNNTVTTVSDRVTSLEANLTGFQSSVSTTYATKNEIKEIDIGGRNLLLNTGGNELIVMTNGASPTFSGAVSSVVNSNGVLTLNCSTTAYEVYYRFMVPEHSTNNLYGMEVGKPYTFSGKALVTTTSGSISHFKVRVQNYVPGTGWYGERTTNFIATADTDDWIDFVSTFTIDEAATGCYISVQLYFDTSWVGTIKLKNLQLEQGNKATSWSPAPEDYPTVESVTAAQSSADAAQDSVDNLKVGGRNLLLNTKAFKGSNVLAGSASFAEESYKDFRVRTKDHSTETERYTDMVTFANIYVDKLGEEYTFSFFAKGSGTLTTYFYGPEGYIKTVKCVQSDGSVRGSVDGASPFTLSEDWARYWVTWTLASEGDITIPKWILFRLSAGGKADICGAKLEKGNRATDWTPAPEDVDADIATAQAAAEAAQATANQNAQDMANIVTNFNGDINNLQTQIDGSITTWFYEVAPTDSNEPAVNWTTTDLKNVHLGDLYYDTITGYCYRYQVKNNAYSWQRITDTDVTKALADAQTAQDTADQKRRVFYTQPTVPYDKGDLWVQGSGGDILRCQTAKVSGQSYSTSDWVVASKYTDDTTANSAVQKANTAQQAAAAAQSDIDNLVIGGRNLLRNSKGDNFTDWAYPGSSIVEDSVKGKCGERTNDSSQERYMGSTRTGIVDVSTEYTFSADIWCNEYLKSYDLFWLSDTEENKKTAAGYVNIQSSANRTVTPNTWHRVTWTFTTHINDYTGYIRIDNNGTTEDGTAAILRVANLKMEKGNRATDWIPAPEDLEDRVTTAETKIIQNSESITSVANRTTNVENKFANYSTTTAMNSAIEQSATSVKSAVSQTYTTKTEFANLDIGGRNLVAGTDNVTEYSGNINDGNGTYYDVWSAKTIDIPTDTEYVVSFDAKAEVAQTIRCHFYSPNTTITSTSSTGQYKASASDGSCDVTITTEWARYWVKWTQTAADTKKSIIVGRNFTENDIYIRAVKFEVGNKATDWTPAPEDMATEKDITAVQTSIETAGERITVTESLIQQLSESIMTLVTDGNGESLMVQTENGWTFSTGQIQSKIDSTSENLNSLTNEMGDVNTTVNALQQAVTDLGVLNDYVKIGVYESEPCIELGESDSDFKLLITNTRIMFMEGTGVPAYINNQSLYIKKAVVEEELQQGEFVWKARSNGNLGLIWKGGNS